MLYQQFYRWLFCKPPCEHEWKLKGHSFVSVGGFYRRQDIYKCKKCRKKEKRPSQDTGTYIMI